jgi:hypothetical protein
MFWLYLFIWWLIGFISVAYDLQPITWADLFVCIGCGFLGLFATLILLLFRLSQAKFWDKPIFPKNGFCITPKTLKEVDNHK